MDLTRAQHTATTSQCDGGGRYRTPREGGRRSATAGVRARSSLAVAMVALLLAVVIGNATATAFATQIGSASIGGVAIVIQADGGCSTLVGNAGTTNVSIRYDTILKSYSGTVGRDRISVRYDTILNSYSGTVGRDRISLRCS